MVVVLVAELCLTHETPWNVARQVPLTTIHVVYVSVKTFVISVSDKIASMISPAVVCCLLSSLKKRNAKAQSEVCEDKNVDFSSKFMDSLNSIHRCPGFDVIQAG